MSLQTRLAALISAVGADIKAINAALATKYSASNPPPPTPSTWASVTDKPADWLDDANLTGNKLDWGSNLNTLANRPSGFYNGDGLANAPTGGDITGGDWWTIIQVRHQSTNNNYGFQIAQGMTTASEQYWIRSFSLGNGSDEGATSGVITTFTPWSKLSTSSNPPAAKFVQAFYLAGIQVPGIKEPGFIAPTNMNLWYLAARCTSGTSCTLRVTVNGAVPSGMTTSSAVDSSTTAYHDFADVNVVAGDLVNIEVVAATGSPSGVRVSLHGVIP